MSDFNENDQKQEREDRNEEESDNDMAIRIAHELGVCDELGGQDYDEDWS